MIFEAEMNGQVYDIKVNEGRSNWQIELRKRGTDWRKFDIPKDDYRDMDDAVCFLFKNQSFMIDEMLLHESLKKGGSMSADSTLNAGMPGKIVKVLVEEGQTVTDGQPLLIMEAMKMENEMRSQKNTKIQAVHVKDGQSVEAGAVLISFES